jgi:low affinity Fe/Cu permease
MRLSLRSGFSHFARQTARATGHPFTLFLAIAAVIIWALTGPHFDYSDTWQLVINTGTTIITFLMVFLIQNTQNRDTDAIQIKLNEIIRALEGAHNAVVSLEDLEEEQLILLREKYSLLAEQARARLKSGEEDTDAPAVGVEACAGGPAGEPARESRRDQVPLREHIVEQQSGLSLQHGEIAAAVGEHALRESRA